MDWLEVAKIAPTAAVVSAIVTLAIRWLDRPRPVLRLEARLSLNRGEASGVGDGPTRATRMALLNVGDGDAYDVKIFGSKCDPAIFAEAGNWVYAASAIKAGEGADVEVGASSDPAKTVDAAVIVTWSTHPQRWFRKRMRISLDEVGIAELLPPGLLPVREIPETVRRTRELEARSPRAQRYLQLPGHVDPWSALEQSEE
ncbi:hypothetical protein [Mycobacterium sp. 236(2023)]|uniref:hypothetical protein n=1 Tax=Mycobacterium sp. 236(2023) TaxID=3038163 RepID=UPI002414FE5D|nr:hypothetical protein [Mycobacterium sp. 236(2023)]MDG4667989.1 hypothetical protein [Mycobacterium sp. 236(2023)]